MNTIKAERLDTRGFITIGVFAAISLVTFFIIGGAVGATPIGTVANIPITVFFTPVAYMLLVPKVRKRGTFLTMGTINALPDLMATNVTGAIASVVGWLVVEIAASANHYKNKEVLILAYVFGYTLHSAGYTLPMCLSNVQYLTDRREISHLTGEALAVYLKMFTWLVFSIMVALTVVTSFFGAMLSTRILKKYFEKAGLL